MAEKHVHQGQTTTRSRTNGSDRKGRRIGRREGTS